MGRCIKKVAVTKIPKAMRYKKRITKLKNSGKQRKAPLKDLYKMLEKGLVCETKTVRKMHVVGDLPINHHQHKDDAQDNNSQFEKQESFKEELGEFENNNGIDDVNSLYSSDENDENKNNSDDDGVAELANGYLGEFDDEQNVDENESQF